MRVTRVESAFAIGVVRNSFSAMRVEHAFQCVRENYKQFLSSSRHPDGR
jgi:hypothetical protein